MRKIDLSRYARAVTLGALAIAIVGSLLVGCASAPTASGTPAPQEAPATTTIRVGLLPISEATPIYLADVEGYFEQRGVDVDLINFTSAVERDTAMQSGQLDAIVNDPVSTLLLNKDKDDTRIVKYTIVAAPQEPMVTILASPQGSIATPAGLAGTEIAISKNSIIEYVTDRVLTKAGLESEEIKKTEVSKIPVRLEMLMNGQLQAASMPEPFAFLAKSRGAKVVADDGVAGIGFSCLTFRQEFLAKNGPTVKAFLMAHAEAVDTINANPEKYRQLFVEKSKVPEAVATTFPMPTFPAPAVPTKEQIDDVAAWMKSQGLITRDVSYENVVDGSYIKQ